MTTAIPGINPDMTMLTEKNKIQTWVVGWGSVSSGSCVGREYLFPREPLPDSPSCRVGQYLVLTYFSKLGCI